MRTAQRITYPADVDAVVAMLSDPQFQRGRAERLHPENLECQVAPAGAGFRALLSGTVPPSRLPAAASRLIRSAVAFTVTEAWAGAAADGTRAGDLTVSVQGAPVKASGTMKMVPGQGTTTVELDLELRVSVPLVGRSLEEKALGLAGHVVRDEERRATAYLQARGWPCGRRGPSASPLPR